MALSQGKLFFQNMGFPDHLCVLLAQSAIDLSIQKSCTYIEAAHAIAKAIKGTKPKVIKGRLMIYDGDGKLVTNLTEERQTFSQQMRKHAALRHKEKYVQKTSTQD